MYVCMYVCIYVCMYVCMYVPRALKELISRVLKGLKRIGTNQGVATSQWGRGAHIHAMHAGGRFGTSVERLGVKSVRVNSAFHPSGVGT